jgi:CRISPR-associated protein Cas1
MRVVHPDRPGRHLVPLHRVESLVLWRGVDATPDVLTWCSIHGVQVSWITQNGKLLASITGHESARPHLRLAQVRSFDDPDRRVTIARWLVAAKLQNYRQLLLRAAHDANRERQRVLRGIAEIHGEALGSLKATQNLTEILGVEGRAARSYFRNLNALIEDAPQGRTRRPPTDAVNCYLSAAYGLLRSSVHSAIAHVGLDASIGFLHGVRGGKPALALDLMEEMRALMADRMVATLFNRGEVRAEYWREAEGGSVFLTDAGWKHLLNAWVVARQREWPHVGLGRKVRAAEIPFWQARALARHLREPEHQYVPWQVAR